MIACLIGVESYIDRLQDGIVILVPEDRMPILRPIAILYGGYLAAILGFWYKPPFSKRGSAKLQQIRFWLAFLCTLALNFIVVYLVWRRHFGSTSPVSEDVMNAVKIAGFMSFIVAPANAYYFGMRAKNGS